MSKKEKNQKLETATKEENMTSEAEPKKKSVVEITDKQAKEIEKEAQNAEMLSKEMQDKYGYVSRRLHNSYLHLHNVAVQMQKSADGKTARVSKPKEDSSKKKERKAKLAEKLNKKEEKKEEKTE